MTIVVTTPPPNNSPLYRLGNGLRIQGTITGPSAIDDTMDASTVSSSAPYQVVALGRIVLAGLSTFDLAFDDILPTSAGGVYGGLVDLVVNWRNAAGTVLDTVSYSGAYVNDSQSGIPSSIFRILYGAVHIEFPATP